MKYLYLSALVGLLCIAYCGKSSAAPANIKPPVLIKTGPSYAGSFIGNVSITITVTVGNINSSIHSVLTDDLMVISTGRDTSKLTLQTDFIQSTSAKLAGNVLTIGSHRVKSNATTYIVEDGSGTFSGNTLTFEFHQITYNSSDNTVVGSNKWVGTMTKQ